MTSTDIYIYIKNNWLVWLVCLKILCCDLIYEAQLRSSSSSFSSAFLAGFLAALAAAGTIKLIIKIQIRLIRIK